MLARIQPGIRRWFKLSCDVTHDLSREAGPPCSLEVNLVIGCPALREGLLAMEEEPHPNVSEGKQGLLAEKDQAPNYDAVFGEEKQSSKFSQDTPFGKVS